MKRIAILAPYVGVIDRGAETFVKEIVLKLKCKYDIDVYTISKEESIRENIRVVSVKESIFFKLYKKGYLTNRYMRYVLNKIYFLIPDVMFQRKFTRECYKIVNKENYSLLFPNNGVWGAYYAKKYRKTHKKPFIYTGHGGIGKGEKIILRSEPNVYVCLTTKHRAWAETIKSTETKTVIIPNGVNVNSFRCHKKTNTKQKIILSVGALTGFKRHKLTIEALAKVDNVQLVIIGEGEEYGRLKKLADDKLPGRHTFISVRYSEIKEYYYNADLFVLPSYNEPFGIVYLEAMASNLPVVAPDDSQRREIIGNAGLYCDVENPEEYAACMIRALNMDWGNTPRDRAKEFDWEKIAEKYMDIIERLI